MTTNVYYTNGTMYYGQVVRMQEYLAESINDRSEKILMNGYGVWIGGMSISSIEELSRRFEDDVQVYCEVRSNFVNGQTYGYTYTKRYATHNRIVTRIIIEEGYHKFGKKVGRISIKTICVDSTSYHNIDDMVATKYREFNNKHQTEYTTGDDEISFHRSGFTDIKYSSTKASERIYFGHIYLTTISTSQYSLISKYNYSASTYARHIANDTGLVNVNNRMYLLNGTIR